MANISGLQSGFIVKSVKEVKKPVRKKPSPKAVVCKCCGFAFEGSNFQVGKRFYENEGDKYCLSCTSFFGMAGFQRGVTDHSPEDTKLKLKRAKEDGYAVMLRSQSFVGSGTGVSFTIDFGDVFKIDRVGSDAEPNGEMNNVTKRFTIDITVGIDTLTLYPHEFGVISWTELMLARQDKDYEEAYLCQEDKTGYFKPSDKFRAELQNMFGDL